MLRSMAARRGFAAALALAIVSGGVRADEPLHVRIDAHLDAVQVSPVAGPASDAEFVRRVFLDLCGRIPTAADARAFLADSAADKREKLIERLLASPEHARHLAIWLDVMLMERRGDKGVPAAEWRKYLFESALANKPFDQLARELLTADGADATLRPAAKFILDRDAEPNVVTRDIARVFFGRDLQCCQCHDHPLVDDYYQDEYYGIQALVGRTFVFVDKKDKNKLLLAEKAEGEPTYVSVFDKAKLPKTARPAVPLGEPLTEPAIAKGEEYLVKPAENVRPVPKLSRRAELAEAASGNRAFQRNIVNRLWAAMFGRGLVHPVDMQHGANPPVDPALLELLASEFAAHKYDMRWLLGELARTKAYGRSIDLPADMPGAASQAAARLAGEEAEQHKLVAAAAAAKEGMTKLADELEAARVAMGPLSADLAKLQAAAAAAKKQADAASAMVAPAQQDFTTKSGAAAPLAEAAAKAAEAAAKLPGNKEVADAAAKLKAQSEQLAAAVSAAQKLLAERQAAAKAATDALAAAQQPVAALNAKIVEATAQIWEMDGRLRGVKAAWQAADETADQLAARIADEKAIAQFVQTADKIAAAEAAVAKADGDVVAARQTLAAQQAEVNKLAAARDEAEKAAAAASTAAVDGEKQQAERQATAAAIGEAFAKTEAARQRVPDDAELAAVGAKLKARADRAMAEVAAAAAALAELQATAKTGAERFAAAKASFDAAAAQMAATTKQVADLEAAAKQAAAQRDGEIAARADAEEALAERLSRRLATGAVRALTSEQLAWSMMQATGVVEAQRAGAIAEWEKANPPATPEATADPARLAARAQAVEQVVTDKLAGNVAPFLPLFAAGAGQPQDDFYATADQALFLANGGHVRGWLAPSGENLAARLVKQTDGKALAEELYLSVLTRSPSGDETADVEKYLAPRTSDRAAAIGELIWSLLTSAEFRFNH